MRAVFFLFFSILSFFAAGQSDDRVKLRDLQAATGDGQVIQSINDTSRWVVPPWADSISVLQDSIVVLYSDGSEVARDTVGPFGGATTVYYQTLRDDGTPLTQRDAINFVATSTVATTLTDDAGNGETEVALSVPTGAIGATELASTAVTPGSYTYGGFTVDADGRLTAASSGTAPVTDHGALTGLSDDDHTQYALLAGRASGQTLNGGTASAENLNLSSTAHATKGNIVFSTVGMGWTRASTNDNMIMQGNTIKATAGRFNYGWGQNVFSASMASETDGNIAIGINNLSAINNASADNNIAIGSNALDAVTSAGSNIAIGSGAGGGLTTGGGNVAIGINALLSNTGGIENFALGSQALQTNTASSNIAIGVDAGRLTTTGANNTYIGPQAGRSQGAGADFNVGIGYQSIYQATLDRTVAIGTQAGYNSAGTGVYIGNLAGYSETSADRLYIDNSNTASPLIGGNLSSNYVGINTAVASLGAALHVTGTGATSATVNLFAENSSGTDLLYLDNSGQLGLKTNLPARTLHVAGEARITDLTTDTPTRIIGADADGDLNEITVSSELLLSGGVLSVGTLSHAALSDLGSPEDDHDQYLNIFGRAGGQIVYGATGASENLDLNSTTNATKGNILLQDEGGNVIIGGAATASRLRMMEASGSGTNYTEFVTQAQAANATYTLPADDGDAGEYMHTDGAGVLSWESADVHGRVLYVSTTGNDATAEIGNILKPYDDPSAAVTAATDGDLIYIFPGTYSPGTVDFGGKSLNYYLCQGAVLNGPYWNPSAKRVIRINGRGSIVSTTTPVFRVDYGSVFTVDVDSIAHSGTYTVRTGNGYISMKARVVRKSTVNTSFVFAENSDLTGRTFDIDINTFLSVDGSVIALYNTTPEDVNGAVNIKYLRKVSTVTAPVFNVFEAGCTRCDIALNVEVITVTGTNSTHGFVYLDTKTFLLTNSTFRFNVGTYTGEHQFFQYINTAEEIDSTSKFLLDCKNCIYTGDYSALWRRNQNQESYMPIYVSGKWESVDNSILSDSTSTNTWAVPIIFENAELKVRNGTYYAIHIYGFGTTGSMEFRNTVFKGQNSGVAAISCATATEFITAGAYQGNTTVDGDATFTTLFKLE